MDKRNFIKAGNFKRNIFFRFLAPVLLLSLIILVFLASISGCDIVDNIKSEISSRLNRDSEMNAAVYTTEKFFDFIIEGDLDSAFLYIAEHKTYNYTIDDFKNEFADVAQIISADIKWVEVKNNIALVGIDIVDRYDGEEKMYKDLEIPLIKDDGDNWKINFWP